ncbi:MAG: TlyA family RNA methyltransferase [Candidatus Melainabacteria bacterium]|nr:TlyA family RNA methyltransferase [Candidatus Melainabacteria bacterium]MBI3309155.1 TlyA family RNA methyltransferase [Candidatus Melainabacteria bacterium]
MPPKKKKMRLDTLLLEKQFFPSREQARSAIIQGAILVENNKVTKPGTFVDTKSYITVLFATNPYVSRGGIKLEYALKYFEISILDKICLDIGASTGGFTDCLLKRGAKKIYSVDVGYGQFDWELRKNPKVQLFERTNVRYLMPDKIYQEKDPKAIICTIDLSFISLSKVFRPIMDLIDNGPETHIITLFKPQFEALKSEVGKRGVVKDKNIHKALLLGFIENISNLGLFARDVTYSPITGSAGNIEFWFDITFKEKDIDSIKEETINQIIEEAHNKLGKR